MTGPVYDSSGAGNSAAGTGGAYSLSVTLPATINAGDLIVIHVAANAQTTIDNLDTPTGFTRIGDVGLSSGAHAAMACYKVAVGGEGGTSVSLTGGYTGATNPRISARAYRFTGNAASSPVEAFSNGSANNTTVVLPNVVTTGANELAVGFSSARVSTTIGDSTGETGGDWTEATAEYNTTATTMQVQTAAMASAGTISGGSATLGASSLHVQIAFAIKPNSGVTVQPSLLTNAQSFFSPKIVTKLKPALLTNTQSFFTPKLATKVKPSLLSNAQTFFAAQIGIGFAPRPTLLTNTQTFYAPKIVTTVKPAALTNTQTFYTPKLKTTVKPAALTNTQTFFAPGLSIKVKPSLLTNTQTFPSARVISVRARPPLLTNVQTFFGPTLKITVRPPELVNVNVFPRVPNVGVTIVPTRKTVNSSTQPYRRGVRPRFDKSQPQYIDQELSKIQQAFSAVNLSHTLVVSRLTTQAVPTGTATVVAFTTESAKSGDLELSVDGGIKCDKAGVYNVSCGVHFTAPANITSGSFSIVHSRLGVVAGGTIGAVTSGDDFIGNTARLIELEAGDVLTLKVTIVRADATGTIPVGGSASFLSAALARST